MDISLQAAKNHFQNALHVKSSDPLATEIIRGLIELVKFLEHADRVLDKIDVSTK